MAQLFMTTPDSAEYDHLIAPQADMLEKARAILGPLVGAGLFVDGENGWAIRLTVMKAITPDERASLKELVDAQDVPVIIEERKKAPALSSVNLRAPGTNTPER